MTTNSTLNWNKKHDGKGYWASSPAGDELVIWGSSKDRDGFTLNVRGNVPVHGVTLAEAKAAAEAWVADQQPKQAPVTAGTWSIDDAGNLWKDGEYIGRIVEETRPGTTSRQFYAQGVTVGSFDARKYIGIGSSSARDLTVAQHREMSDRLQ